MHRPIFLERSVARNRSLSGYAPHARVELDLGNVPRRLQAKRGGEEGFDLGAHAVRGRCQSRAVLPPIVMSVEKSISTRNGMEPRTLPGPPHSERISGLWISPIKSWLSVVSPAGHSSPNPANLGSFITLCASDSVKDILQIRSLASTRVMTFECGGPANPPKVRIPMKPTTFSTGMHATHSTPNWAIDPDLNLASESTSKLAMDSEVCHQISMEISPIRLGHNRVLGAPAPKRRP